jgi:hypothetical protein
MTFGHIKNKVLVKLTESYGTKEFKGNINKYFKPIMNSSVLKEMYSLYEEIESKTFDDKETAQIYVEELSRVLKEKHHDISKSLFDLNESLKDVDKTTNHLYEWLDHLSTPDKLGNISSKVVAKKKLVEHLVTDKTQDELKVDKSVNENLLNTVLVNNFNSDYGKDLTESEKEKLHSILSLDIEELNIKFSDLQESINSTLDLLTEEDSSFKSKADEVRNEVIKMDVSKYNLYRLEDLLEGLS